MSSDLRRKAWEWREQLAMHPRTPKRTRGCSIVRHSYLPAIEMEGDRAWWTGVVRCRSRYCPPCWLTRRAQLAREVTWVAEQWREQHRTTPLLGTLTVRHSARDHVSIVRDVRATWRALLQARVWRGWREDYGVEMVASEEITHGAHGWHPHMHVLLLPRRQVPAGDVAWIAEAWRARVLRRMGTEHEPDARHGTDVRHCHVAQYVSKLGFELSDAGAAKQSRTPLKLLELGDLDLYAQLQHERHRARDATWSRGLRAIRDAMPKPEGGRLVYEELGPNFDAEARRGRMRILAALEASEQRLAPFGERGERPPCP